MVDPIDKQFLFERQKIKEKLDYYNNVIEERITYIANLICKVCGRKYETWYYIDAPEGAIGDFDRAKCFDSIRIEIESMSRFGSNKIDDFIYLKDGTKCNLNEIPIRWLFEKFEEELVIGRKLYLEKQKKLKK